VVDVSNLKKLGNLFLDNVGDLLLVIPLGKRDHKILVCTTAWGAAVYRTVLHPIDRLARSLGLHVSQISAGEGLKRAAMRAKDALGLGGSLTVAVGVWYSIL
jgi:hypothetical protein